MKIRYVVRNLHGAQLRAVVVDDAGTPKEIHYTWHHRDGGKAPLPKTWYESVLQEARQPPPSAVMTDIHEMIP